MYPRAVSKSLVAPEDNKMASTSKHSAEMQDTDVLKLKKQWCIDFLEESIVMLQPTGLATLDIGIVMYGDLISNFMYCLRII